MKWKTKIFITLIVPVLVLLSPLAAHADMIAFGPVELLVYPAIGAFIIASMVTGITTSIIISLRSINKENCKKQKKQ